MAWIVLDPPSAKCPVIATLSDNRGVVYVEFLIAFMPLFLLFLGTCQLTLLTAARVVVSHAAFAAVRSAIVVLEDPADVYDGAPRGSLSEGKPQALDPMPLLGQLGTQSAVSLLTPTPFFAESISKPTAQQGARMAAIRLAALMPLMPLAPNKSYASRSDDSLDQSLSSNTGEQMAFAFGYSEAAAAVTVHSNESSELLATEPLERKGMVTARVTYLYYCGIPIVRALMCRSLSSLIDISSSSSSEARRLTSAAHPTALKRLLLGAPRYVILTGQATLPNQGADYDPTETSPRGNQ
jgi:hypothetical protein